MRLILSFCLVACMPLVAQAQQVMLSGYADARVVERASGRSWVDGGLGKTQFGGTGVAPEFGGAAGDISYLPTPEILTKASIRIDPALHGVPELLEAYARYRPVSTTPLRFSLKAGAFFPPVSLENDGVGWSSYWTLSPSAVNTWVGEELRTFGTESTVEWRGENGTLSALGAVYMADDGVGTILQTRGWAIGDSVMGLGGTLRNPDAVTPHRMDPFLELDGRVGWYGGVAWAAEDWGKIQLLRYDNQASPSAGHGPHGWNTDFWSLGAQTEIAGFEVLAQGMSGHTIIKPTEDQYQTVFQAAYVLIGREIGEWNGEWRAAARGDIFRTDSQYNVLHPLYSEHGAALTLALNWKPESWLRIALEELHMHSLRGDLANYGQNPRQTADQLQLAFRFIY